MGSPKIQIERKKSMYIDESRKRDFPEIQVQVATR